ncbi:MAG: HD domain-containing protein [Muribaculaceae bacterium]|nr:HD domain-containing protein [Muribaculaceae bacterium]MCM1440499.1 HD domain-containing protein [Roseburia sp.]
MNSPSDETFKNSVSIILNNYEPSLSAERKDVSLQNFLSIYKIDTDVVKSIAHKINTEHDSFKNGDIVYGVTGEKGVYRDVIFKKIFFEVKKCVSSKYFAYIDFAENKKVNLLLTELQDQHFTLNKKDKLYLFVDKFISINWPQCKAIRDLITDDDRYSGPAVIFIVGIDTLPSSVYVSDKLECEVINISMPIVDDFNKFIKCLETNNILYENNRQQSGDSVAEFIKGQKCAVTTALVKKVACTKQLNEPNKFWNALSDEDIGNFEEAPKNIEDEINFRNHLDHVACSSHVNFLQAKDFVRAINEINVDKFYLYTCQRAAADVFKLKFGVKTPDKNTLKNYKIIEGIFQSEADFFTGQLLRADTNAMQKVCEIVFNDYFLETVEPAGQNHLLYLLGLINKANDFTIKSNLVKKKNECEKKYLYSDPATDSKAFYGFRLRTIALTFMCWNDKSETKEFFKKILKDPILRKVNNGFHLWYYNDRADKIDGKIIRFNDVAKDTLDNTLNGLLRTINIKDALGEDWTGHTLLQLFTCCTLLQDYFDVAIHSIDVIKQIYKKLRKKEEWFGNGNGDWADRELNNYFNKMCEFLDKIIEKEECEVTDTVKFYNDFALCREVKRRNWLIRGVDSSKCESVAEHMYSAWLLAFLMLPEEMTADEIAKETNMQDIIDKTYNKHDILTMLLLHDLPKSKTGDLTVYLDAVDGEKRGEYDEIMQEIVFAASFKSVESNLRECALWNEWRDEQSFNSLVAHDINQIQAVYQYLYYKEKKDIKFESKHSFFGKWIKDEDNVSLSTYLKTNVCKEIGGLSTYLKTNVCKEIVRKLFLKP